MYTGSLVPLLCRKSIESSARSSGMLSDKGSCLRRLHTMHDACPSLFASSLSLSLSSPSRDVTVIYYRPHHYHLFDILFPKAISRVLYLDTTTYKSSQNVHRRAPSFTPLYCNLFIRLHHRIYSVHPPISPSAACPRSGSRALLLTKEVPTYCHLNPLGILSPFCPSYGVRSSRSYCKRDISGCPPWSPWSIPLSLCRPSI